MTAQRLPDAGETMGEQAPCNECAGTGRVERRGYVDNSGRPDFVGECCDACGGSGTIQAMTSHLGPDDYEYEEDCPACAGCGSANLMDVIESLPYSQHRARSVAVIERAAVLRIVEAHLTRLAITRAAAEVGRAMRGNGANNRPP